jgi:hypothetical protein
MNKIITLIIGVIAFVASLYLTFTSPHGQVSPNLILGGTGLCISLVVVMLSIFDIQNQRSKS